MFAKFAAFVYLFSIVSASGLYGGYSNLGYGLGDYSYIAPSYTAPIVTKAIVPTYSYAAYAPAISTVSRYQVHSSPIVKSYVAAPIVKSYVAPVSSYSTYASPYFSYPGGYNGYGYGGYKYLW